MFGTGMVMVFDTEILYIVGVSTIGVVSLAYVLFGFSTDSSKKKLYIRGLKNVKNNCFINSILQSLASSDSMVQWLNQTATTRINNSNNNDNFNLIRQLSFICDKINNKIDCDRSEILSPEGVLDSLRKHRWMFSADEQDAFELFSVLLTTLDFESNQLSLALSIRDSVQSSNNHHCDHQNNTLMDEFNNKSKLITRINNPMIESMDKILRNSKNSLPTRGILSNHLKCQNCRRNYPIHLEIFNSISLSLPTLSSLQLGSSIPLEMCLNKFLTEEEIDDFHCQYCNQKSKFSKRIELIKLPRLLCFHVHRLVWLECQQTKRVEHIKFPEVLIMDPFKHNSIKFSNKKDREQLKSSAGGDIGKQQQSISHEGISAQYIYILNSVIVHLGNNHSGHFVCYRRSRSPTPSPTTSTTTATTTINDNDCRSLMKSKWFKTSDLLVKEVNKKEVFASCAYMLFYEKIKKESFLLKKDQS
ncbi:ubiquitin specific protease 30 [Dermatophagoides pteronyssinus]|uniref:ubiquitin specific protease 30 n=1 Tax=Dermatophagoides pteronyssinus TaxID=6956 RepID=UPI003F67DF5E